MASNARLIRLLPVPGQCTVAEDAEQKTITMAKAALRDSKVAEAAVKALTNHHIKALEAIQKEETKGKVADQIKKREAAVVARIVRHMARQGVGFEMARTCASMGICIICTYIYIYMCMCVM